MDYPQFLETKRIITQPVGIEPSNPVAPLFEFQRDIVAWALRRGRAAIFADCGLGKTIMELEWGRQISEASQDRPVLILAPLAVAEQTVREGQKFGIAVRLCETAADAGPGVNITNYEKLHKFDDPNKYAGLVLDESSILKAFDGKTRNQLIEFADQIPYRLACTATPAPNDHTELGNHAEFLSVLSMPEMLATFFVHDGGDTSKWRLKGHAEDQFWQWVASWAVMLRKPSDLGYSDDGFDLPPLEIHSHVTAAGDPSDTLFPVEAKTLNDRRTARRDSLTDRVLQCSTLVNNTPGSWLVWCDLNAESVALSATIKDCVQVTGSDSADHKRQALLDFAAGKVRVLVSKPSICGFGMNFQVCHQIAFVGLSDSYEAFYQAVRRCWRFGQTEQVDCHVITAETEGAVVKNIQRKESESVKMAEGMVKHMAHINRDNVRGAAARHQESYAVESKRGESWTAHLGDSVELLKARPSESVDYVIFSPPFASLYTYSASDRDMGNTRTHEEFAEHFAYLLPELFRVMKPGRLLSFHCMNLPLTKERDGVIGIRDFRGELIRLHQAAGFIFHSEVCIWKDPVTAMQRTKAIGLLYKQLRKDSCMSRQGIPDYLVTMRKPGENQERVTKTHEGFPVDRWQRYASPVWMDIDASDTLQRESAREEKDERHICPLQLGVIRRAIELWTNPSDLVLSPFGGIGSEGYVAVQMGRRAEIIELKRSYWEQAWRNLAQAELTGDQAGLFAASAE